MMRIEALTFYRFIAAIVVVLHHFSDRHFGSNLIGLSYANQMVTFFFVLSGFVMVIAYHAKEVPTRDYLVHRVARIVPVYLVALALTAYFRSSTTMQAVLMNLAFLQAWFPPYPLSANFPAWSLSVEMFFYLSFPFLLVNLKNIAPERFMLLAAACWAFTQTVTMNLLNDPFYTGFPSRSHDLLYYFPVTHLCSFLLGMGAASLFLHNQERWRIPPVPAVLAIAAIFVLVVFDSRFEAAISAWAGTEYRFGGSFYAPLFTVLILATALSDNFLTRILSLRFLVLLGEASYAVYILQVPMYMLFNKWLVPLIPASPAGHFLLYLLFLTLVAILSFYCLEKPGKRLVHRLFARA